MEMQWTAADRCVVKGNTDTFGLASGLEGTRMFKHDALYGANVEIAATNVELLHRHCRIFDYTSYICSLLHGVHLHSIIYYILRCSRFIHLSIDLYYICHAWTSCMNPGPPSSKYSNFLPHPALHPFGLGAGIYLGDSWIGRLVMGEKAAVKSRPKGKASSSGSASPTTSSNSTPERVGKYDISHLPKAWDDEETIRERLRNDHQLLLHLDPSTGEAANVDVDGSVANVKCNLQVLIPLADTMAQNSLLMPNIDRLIQSVDMTYKRAKKARSLEHCYQMAWACRRLLVTGKAYCYRDVPPEEPKPINFEIICCARSCMIKNIHFGPNILGMCYIRFLFDYVVEHLAHMVLC